jgi:archaemetzincin
MRPSEENPRFQAIQLAGIDPLPAPLLDKLVASLSRRVSVPCRIREQLQLPELPRLEERQEQVDADTLLRLLEAGTADDGGVLVALTSLDLAIPIFTFVFGRARRGGRIALVSTHRLDPQYYGLAADHGVLERRVTDEILHELGHVAGLRHCEQYDCLMHFAATAEAVDLRGTSFCATCVAALPEGLRPGRGGGGNRGAGELA